MAARSTHAIRPRRLLLVGMMGSGKSTLGRALERRLGWPYLDNDRILETVTGSGARELLTVGGEVALREGEGAALRVAVSTRPPAVVGVAAGTILDADLRGALAVAGDVVWLRGLPETLARRAIAVEQATEGRHRPWLAEGPEAARAWFAAADHGISPGSISETPQLTTPGSGLLSLLG